MKSICYLFIYMGLAGSLAAQVNAPTKGLDMGRPLTDEERHTSENFVHEGRAVDVIRQECLKSGKENRAACTDDDATVISPEADMGIEAISKIYSLFAASGFTSGASTGEAQDYCGLVPAATEITAQSYQAFQQEAIVQPLGVEPTPGVTQNQQIQVNKQKETLEALRRSHKARQTAATMQVAGWGATTTCYAGQTIARFPAVSKKDALKLAGAALLTSFYGMKVQRHKKYADIVKGIIKKLPQPGDCNPITERHCYCNHRTTENDPKYCLPQIYAKRAREGIQVTSCVNNKLQVDPTCKCLGDNSCFDKTIKDLTVRGQFGTLSNPELLQPFNQIARGSLNAGRVEAAVQRQQAIGKRALDKLAQNLKPASPLTDLQKRQAKALVDLGANPIIAPQLASLPVTNKSREVANRLRASGGLGLSSLKVAKKDAQSEHSKVLYFKGDLGSKSKSSRYNRRRGKRSGKGKKPANAQVLNFADKATQKASINRDPDGNLFHMISRRYQMSGWRTLEVPPK